MEIKDVLHLYIGSKVLTTHDALNNGEPQQLTVSIHNLYDILYRYKNSKLILRKLSSITDDDRKEIFRLVFNRKFVGDNITRRDEGRKEARWVLWSGVDRLFLYDDGDIGADCDLQHFRVHMPTIVKHLLSKGFDLFNLIENKLAIDLETIKQITR